MSDLLVSPPRENLPLFNTELVSHTQAFLARPRLRSAASRQQYAREVGAALAGLGIDLQRVTLTELRRIESSAIINYMESLRATLKPSSIRRRVSVLHGWFEHLAKGGWAGESPVVRNPVDTAEVPVRPADQQPKDALTAEEVGRLLHAVDAGSTLRDRRDAALVYTALFLGLRRSELVSLKVGDLGPDVAAGRSMRVATKGGKRVERLLPPAVVRRVDSYLTLRQPLPPTAPLFGQHRHGRADPADAALSPSQVYRRIVLWLERAGISATAAGRSRPSPHSLRATFITEALQRAPLADVQQWIGHSSPATTAAYSRGRLELSRDPSGMLTFAASAKSPGSAAPAAGQARR